MVLTVIVAVPADTPFTTPDALTVATLLSLLIQVTALFVAFDGETVAVKATVLPTLIVALAVFSFTLAVGITSISSSAASSSVPPLSLIISLLNTVTLTVAFFPPSFVVAVIVAVPTPFAVIVPVLVTVATLVLLLVQVTALFVAFDGKTVALILLVSPTSNVALFLLNVIDCTLIGETVTLTVAFFPPSFVVAVIVAVPTPSATIVPSPVTVATLVLLLVQVTALFVTFDGLTVAVIFSVAPINKLTLVFDTSMPVTLTVGFTTVTVAEALFPPSFVVAVIVAVPTPFAVIVPVLVTVATLVLLLFQVTALFDAAFGETIASNFSVLPVLIVVLVFDSFTLVTAVVTVTVAVVVFPVSLVFTVIVAFPLPTPFTTPLALTVATLVLLLFQVTALFVVLEGATVAVREVVFPVNTDKLVLFNFTLVDLTMIFAVKFVVSRILIYPLLSAPAAVLTALMFGPIFTLILIEFLFL